MAFLVSFYLVPHPINNIRHRHIPDHVDVSISADSLDDRTWKHSTRPVTSLAKLLSYTYREPICNCTDSHIKTLRDNKDLVAFLSMLDKSYPAVQGSDIDSPRYSESQSRLL